MAIEIKAPDKEIRIFLAGSIEMDTAGKWQNDLFNALVDIPNLIVYNPRRESWDNGITQSKSDMHFNEQVTWEMNKLDESDLIVMWFDENTKSPISLLELGLHANSGKLIVLCQDKFWRRGNVEMVCDRFNIPLYSSSDVENFVSEIRYRIIGDLAI